MLDLEDPSSFYEKLVCCPACIEKDNDVPGFLSYDQCFQSAMNENENVVCGTCGTNINPNSFGMFRLRIFRDYIDCFILNRR